MPKNRIKGQSTKPNSNKATGRKYGKSQLASNRRNQAKRVELNREARKRGLYGKRHKIKKDISHTKDGKMVLEDKTTNRKRNGKSGKSTLKAA